MKTAETIEQNKAQHAQNSVGNKAKRVRGNPDKIKPFRWKPGQSGNPGGRPKNDVASLLAQDVIEHNYQAAFEGLSAQLNKGNAYTFKELAERGYGKLKEPKEVTHIYQDVTDAELSERIAQLERDLGLASAIDDAGRTGIAAAGEIKTNGHAKDSELLPR